jgi:hypothetical protein
VTIKPWVWMLVGLLACLGAGCLVVVGTGVYFISQTIDAKRMTPAEAEAEFADVRQRFQHDEPLLEMRDGGAVSTERLEERARNYHGPLPTTLHILAWEEGEHRRVRLSLPLWLLKWKTGHGVNLDLDEAGIEKLEIKAEDLERAGPALLVDRKEGRQRLLMWTD